MRGTTTPAFSLQGSRQFVSWLGEVRASLAFSTYQSGKLFLLGVQDDGRFSVFERTFERVMGPCASPDAQTLWIGTLWQLWRFQNAVPPGQVANGFDRLYVPQCAYTTGDVDIHDIALDADGRPLVRFRTWRNTITGPACAELTPLLDFAVPQRWSIAHLYQSILGDQPHVARG
jgi:uncharacterized protein (TIGR03032 family)